MMILDRFFRALETPPSFINDFAGFMVILSYMVTMAFLGFGLLHAWIKKDSDSFVPFWEGFMVKGYQFPYVLIGLRILLGGNVIINLMGLLV